MKDAAMVNLNQPSSPALTREQIYGALLGAVVGDALGWPYEQNAGRIAGHSSAPPDDVFHSWRRRAGGRFLPHELVIGPGEYSDDTQLLLATARAVLWYTSWARYLSQYELPLWLLYERGGGGATRRAADSWLRGQAPWANDRLRSSYFDAGGNGVAMRVLPHVFVPQQTDAHLMRDVLRNGILTHGHPRALIGARLYALAASWIARAPQPIAYGTLIDALLDEETVWGQLLEGASGSDTSSHSWIEAADQHFSGGYLEVWRRTVDEIRDGLKFSKQALASGALADDYTTLHDLGCFDRRSNGSGVVAALAVVYLFAAHATNPMVGLRTIAYARNADTDTIASMLGGLFGLSHRVEWIPEPLRAVQDCQYLEQIATAFAESLDPADIVRQGSWKERDARAVQRALEQGTTTLHLGILGQSTVIERRELKTGNMELVGQEWRLKVASGQTVFISRVQKVSPRQLREQSPPAPALKIAEAVTEPQLKYEPRPLPLDEQTFEVVESPYSAKVTAALLAELAAALPGETAAGPVLQATAQLLLHPPESPPQLRVLITEAAPALDEATRDCYVAIAEQLLFTP